ncbi:MAG TPA: GGDEF domain-containing protein [Burkholderiaceae bacterium]|nr:GGDEF domain-containing protein [Burkholderiaceae bacterium]HNB45316.1 GGDEF domain-containing protein [Burkholderiaceae bacterium]HNG81707.1 GGDEF domain-containing protein [Burkholderiaceae bacterium]
MQSFTDTLGERLLGPVGPQRIRVAHCLFALGVYALFAGCQGVAVGLGVMPRASLGWMAVYLTGACAFYLAVRSGWSLDLPGDPSLTLAQTLFGLVAAAGAYAYAGPLRGGVIAVCMLVVLFGASKLTPRQGWASAAFGVLALGAVMTARLVTGAADARPAEEVLLFLIALITAAAMGVLVARLARLRLRLVRQREDLAEALARIQLLATRDELTGLPNRRAMIDALQTATARQARVGEPVALVMIDLDHFKAINDGHGHRVGDGVLRGFAERAHTALRAVDLLGRWGGEEFLLLLPDTTLEQAQLCVERLREQLRRTPFDELVEGLTLRFSAGITACRGPADLDAAIERADRALYQAKAEGRDRSATA